jgi:WXG100 family type VII secretion target
VPTIDWALLINWIVSGFIGFVFGMISAWISYRFERKRDDIAWQREREKLQEQHRHDLELLEKQFQQKIIELQEQLAREQTSQLRNRLLQGIDNAQETIETLQRSRSYVRGGVLLRVTPEFLRSIAAEFEKSASAVQELLALLQNKMTSLNDVWEGITEQPLYEEWEEFVRITLRQVGILEGIAHQLVILYERFRDVDSDL